MKLLSFTRKQSDEKARLEGFLPSDPRNPLYYLTCFVADVLKFVT